MNHETRLSKGLDYYKATMGQVEFIEHPDAEVTFELKNRADRKLSEFVSTKDLQDRLATLQEGWQPDELAYLASLQNQDGTAQFSAEYLDFLADNPLPPVDISYDTTGELAVSTTGKWPLATFWETVVMSELNELYFAKKLATEDTSLDELYAEGDRRLSEKIAQLKERPDITFSDFGTRRRFSYDWHRHVIERLATELPDNFVGTSNIYLAHKLDLAPIGTFAHEIPMVYAAMADANHINPLNGHNQVLQDWDATYKGDLSTALTDTFTSEFFFSDFTPEQAARWKALRHDSGDPLEFGDRAISFYEKLGINPLEKTIVFSDGLTLNTIIELADYFKNRINVTFGWGTTLTNDLGVTTNNFVMKAVRVNNTPTVKLSDVSGKHTGPIEKITQYSEAVTRAIGRSALQTVVA
jgi:nicotinate phosphoribosyltransferase